MKEAKDAMESFAQAKGPSDARIASPKVNKPNSAGDACVFDLLK